MSPLRKVGASTSSTQVRAMLSLIGPPVSQGPPISQGAVIVSWRRAAMNVMVLLPPNGALPISLSHRAARSRSGAMLVLVRVSSMKTNHFRSTKPWWAFQRKRLRATSACPAHGRARFFEAERTGMREGPHPAVIDIQPQFGQFGHLTAQREAPNRPSAHAVSPPQRP